MLFSNGSGAAVRAELTLEHQFLPGCKNCGSAHPMAVSPRLPTDVCQTCGLPTAELGEPVVVPALLGGFRGWLARVCFWIADRIAAVIRRLEQ
jgi:hypothetical protein